MGTNPNCLKIALVGTMGSGKSCFIAGLRWLGNANNENAGKGAKTITNKKAREGGAHIKALVDALEAGRIPESTGVKRNLAFSELYEGTELSFECFDYKGGDLATDGSILEAWKDSRYLLVLLDVDKEGRFPHGEDITTLFDSLSSDELSLSGKRLCFLLTKADRHGMTQQACDHAAARAFVQAKFPHMLKRVKSLGYTSWDCFYVASLGVEPLPPTSEVPFATLPGDRRPHPFGYEAVLDWIVSSIRRERVSWAGRLLMRSLLVLAPFLVVGIAAVDYRRGKLSDAENPNLTLQEQSRALSSMLIGADARERILSGKLDSYSNALSQANSLDGISEVVTKWKNDLFSAGLLSESLEKRRTGIDAEARGRYEQMLKSSIETARRNGNQEEVRRLIERANGDRLVREAFRQELADVSKDLADERYDAEKRKIREITVGDDATRLNEKMQLVDKFSFRNPGEKTEAAKAVKLMRAILTQKSFTLSEAQVGTLKNVRRTYLLFGSGDACSKKDMADGKNALPHTQYRNGTAPQWNENEIQHASLQWTPGQKIRVEWRWNARCGIWDTILACKEFNGHFTALLDLLDDGVTMDDLGVSTRAPLERGPWLKVSCKDLPKAASDYEFVRKYILPGSYWW